MTTGPPSDALEPAAGSTYIHRAVLAKPAPCAGADKTLPDTSREMRSARGGGGRRMRDEFIAVVERDKGGYIANCPRIRGANGQGESAARPARDARR